MDLEHVEELDKCRPRASCRCHTRFFIDKNARQRQKNNRWIHQNDSLKWNDKSRRLLLDKVGLLIDGPCKRRIALRWKALWTSLKPPLPILEASARNSHRRLQQWQIATAVYSSDKKPPPFTAVTKSHRRLQQWQTVTACSQLKEQSCASAWVKLNNSKQWMNKCASSIVAKLPHHWFQKSSCSCNSSIHTCKRTLILFIMILCFQKKYCK